MNTNSDRHSNPEDQSWFERPANIQKMIIGLIVVCVGLLLAEFTYTNEHMHFKKYESIPGFQAAFGFVAFVVIVFLGMGLRLIIKRDEDYYDR